MAEAKINIEEMRSLVTGLEGGLERLTEARDGLTSALYNYAIDHTLGNGVQKAIDWADEELPGVRRRLALAEALEGSKPEWDQGTVKFDDETDISSLSPEQAAEDGEEAAQALIDSRGDVSPELANQIKENMNDPYFAHAFASNASPEEIASVLDTLDSLGEAQAVDNFDTVREDLVVGLGTLFGTATRSTGDLAMPSDYAEQWTDAITAETGMEGGDAPQNQAQYLSLLMSQGVYGREFLNDVGDTLYEFENEGEDGAVWGPKSANMDPVLDNNGDPVVDVMATFMLALENNPLAAQDFFTEGGTETVEINGEDVEVNRRLQYMTQDRTWDWEADASNGGNFGAALEAATTTYRNQEDTGIDSADIASQTFALIGDETRSNDGWKMWDGMRGNVATMLSSYSPDLLRVAYNQDADPDFGSSWNTQPEEEFYGDGAPYGASLDPALVQEILGTFGEDGNDEHLETVLSGVGAASQWRMSVALDQALQDGTEPVSPVAILTGQNVPQLATATNEMASALGWVINGAYHGALNEEELEAKQAEMRSQVFGALTSLPGVGPTGQWSSFAFDQITSRLGDEMGSTDPSAGGEFAELSSGEKTQLEQMIINQMLASGYWDQQYIDQANGSPDGTRYEGPPQDAIVPGSDPPQIDFESEAYQDWRRSKFPLDEFLNTHIYPPFQENLDNGLSLAGR